MGSVTHSAKNLKTRKRRNYQKCAFFLMGGEGGGRADVSLNLFFFYALG